MLSCRNQSIDLLCKSIDWFLYAGNFGVYWVSTLTCIKKLAKMITFTKSIHSLWNRAFLMFHSHQSPTHDHHAHWHAYIQIYIRIQVLWKISGRLTEFQLKFEYMILAIFVQKPANRKILITIYASHCIKMMQKC